MSTLTSKVFMNGNSQAIRIPQEFRLDTSQVEITRTSSGDLVIHPITAQRGENLMQVLARFDTEYADILEEDMNKDQPQQDRETL